MALNDETDKRSSRLAVVYSLHDNIQIKRKFYEQIIVFAIVKF
jgi:hypothetical protein